MTVIEKHLVVALSLSTFVIILNIIAVTQGSEVDYLSQIGHFISNLFSLA